MNNTSKKPIEIEYSENGLNLYIFFGGISAGLGMPIFEFYNSSKILDQNKIFIRDFSQCWYQNGLPGIGKDIDSIKKYIIARIEEIKPVNIFFVGNSMGGYAAILFATLISRGEVIAFAPQTFISPLLRLKHKDFRWKEQILTTYMKSLFKRKIWNLQSLLEHSKSKLKISVFVSIDNRLDYIHALHIKNITGVNIYEFGRGGHAIVKSLKDEGKLQAIMSGTYT